MVCVSYDTYSVMVTYTITFINWSHCGVNILLAGIPVHNNNSWSKTYLYKGLTPMNFAVCMCLKLKYQNSNKEMYY